MSYDSVRSRNGTGVGERWQYLSSQENIFRLPPYDVIRIKRGEMIPPINKPSIIHDIMTVISTKMTAELRDIEVYAMAGYPIVDISDPLIAKSCAVDVIAYRNAIEAIVLTHYGNKYERKFCLGDPKAISIYLQTDMLDHIRRKKEERTIRNYGIVLNAAQVPYEQLDEYHFYPDELDIKLTDSGKTAEVVTRMVRFNQPDSPIPFDHSEYPSIQWPPRVLTENDLPKIIEIQKEYPHSSFDVNFLARRKHMGLFSKDGILVGMVGYQGEAEQELIRIMIATDTVTTQAYRKTGLPTMLRLYSFQEIAKETRKKGKEPLFIADFASEKVAEKYAPTVGYKLAAPFNQPEFARWYWIGFELK